MTTDQQSLSVGLPALAVVDARGADAAAFLQGQLSNDLADLAPGEARLAGYCSPKGRLLALPLVLALPGGGLRLVVPREIVAGFVQRLSMFVLRADVSFAPREDLACRALLVTADAPPELPLAHGVAALPETPPAELLGVHDAAEGDAQLCRWHDAPAPLARRRYLLVTAGAADGPVSADAALGDLDGDSLWRLGDILAGVPRIGAALAEAFVPQMVNLEQVGALSFRKGCYPGQEIVARMQYLGKLKRHMRRFRLDAARAPAPGTAVVGDGGAEAGRVVDAVATDGGAELLAVVRIGVDPATLRVGAAPLAPRPLPYAPPGGEGEVDASASARV